MSQKERLAAILSVLGLFGLIWLYTREFSVFSNTIGAQKIVFGSMVAAAALILAAVWRFRERFKPWSNHVTELLLLGVFGLLFAPLFGSLLNRGLSHCEYQPFEFVSETPYLASGYGILKDEKIRPTGWYLTVREGKTLRRFRYKTQAYYPISRPGDTLMLPIKKGFFGVRVMDLK